MSEILKHVGHTALDAASAPAVKVSAASTITASGAAAIAEAAHWASSGPGMVALLGLAVTVVTLIVTTWARLRDDRRAARAEARAEQERQERSAVNAAKLARLRHGVPLEPETDTDAMGLP